MTVHVPMRYRRQMRQVVLVLVVRVCLSSIPGEAEAATAFGEIQDRPAPVWRCPRLPCSEPNVFNITVAVHYDASASDLEVIRDLVSDGSAALFDATDGQAEIGEAFIYNNAFGTSADLRIYPSTNDTWWCANTGRWKNGGSMHVSINRVLSASAPGEVLAHEFVHLVFDARDEYQTLGGDSGTATCPVPQAVAAGQLYCLMDDGGRGNSSELCWGHGNPADLTDLSGGNHDPDHITEQSMSRANRSCWDQVVWSWPDHFTMPTGAPDPGTGGRVIDPTRFVLADNTVRVVLVLDESGSMSFEWPTRLARLQEAARDFVSLAENDTELGIVSYSTDAEPAHGHADVAVASLGSNRSAWYLAIENLNPRGATNIGDGLRKARDMIMAAGGVTANTFIVLMTDGLNNQPLPEPPGHLNDVLATLSADGIPVYVTCTGGDNGLASQCSEIASASGGFYVDSASGPVDLQQAFTDFHETISGREALNSVRATLGSPTPRTVFVEEGSESVTFVLVWEMDSSGSLVPEYSASLVVTDPAGGQHTGLGMASGQYLRMNNPMPGEWEMQVHPSGYFYDDVPYIARAYTRNQVHSMTAAVRHRRVLPGEPIHIYALPRSFGGGITHPEQTIHCRVYLPNGDVDNIELDDQGSTGPGGIDDLAADGVFSGVYGNTTQAGPYQFMVNAEIENWSQHTDRSQYDPDQRSLRFEREVRLSAAVGERVEPRRIPLAIEFVPNQGTLLTWLPPFQGSYAVWYAGSPRQGWTPVATLNNAGNLEEMEWLDDGSETGFNPLSPHALQGYYRVTGSE